MYVEQLKLLLRLDNMRLVWIVLLKPIRQPSDGVLWLGLDKHERI